MHYCVLCLFYLILILYNICATQQTTSMSQFLSMFCVFHLTMCVVPCPCPENKDFSTNCSNFFQSKMLFGFCNGHSREQRLRRSRREVEGWCSRTTLLSSPSSPRLLHISQRRGRGKQSIQLHQKLHISQSLWQRDIQSEEDTGLQCHQKWGDGVACCPPAYFPCL